MRQTIILAVLLACTLAVPGAAQEPFNFGATWASRTKNERLAYLEGVRDGVERMPIIKSALRGRLLNPKADAAALRSVPLSARQTRLLDRMIDAEVARYDTERFGIPAVSEVMTTLYLDPANTFIAFIHILEVAERKLRGVPPMQIEEFLSALRVGTGRSRWTLAGRAQVVARTKPPASVEPGKRHPRAPQQNRHSDTGSSSNK